MRVSHIGSGLDCLVDAKSFVFIGIEYLYLILTFPVLFLLCLHCFLRIVARVSNRKKPEISESSEHEVPQKRSDSDNHPVV